MQVVRALVDCVGANRDIPLTLQLAKARSQLVGQHRPQSPAHVAAMLDVVYAQLAAGERPHDVKQARSR